MPNLRENGHPEAAVGALSKTVEWCRMKFKASKCRSLIIQKGKVVEKDVVISGEVVPSVKQKGIKSLGRLFSYPLSDRKRGAEVQAKADEGMRRIVGSALTGKMEVLVLSSCTDA